MQAVKDGISFVYYHRLKGGDSALFATPRFLFIFAASFEDMPHCSTYDINQASGDERKNMIICPQPGKGTDPISTLIKMLIEILLKKK